MINEIKQDAEARMEKSLEALRGHIAKILQAVHNQAY